jgi:3-oxoacyl-[acyl-carrier protein] reductase
VKISLKEHNILVTGGARGLGRAYAEKISQAGGHVAIADIDIKLAQHTASQIVNAHAYQCDLATPDDMGKLHQQILKDMDRSIDILINNAGVISYNKGIKSISIDEWDHLIDLNLRGAFWAVREFVDDMKKRGNGKIINISSLAARVGGIDAGVHYTVSKSGIIGLTKSLARKLGPFGITVNAVAPGIMLTEPVKQQISGREAKYISQIPLGRLGTPEDAANAVLFFCSHLSDYITGCVLDVNGGMYMA